MNVTDPVSGDTVTLTYHVTPADTALALGSGDVEVLGTPRLMAWCEAATVAVLTDPTARPGPQTTVGVRVELGHLAPTPVGGVVQVTAVLEKAEGARRVFAVSAVDAAGRLVATGTVTRAVVDRESFLPAR